MEKRIREYLEQHQARVMVNGTSIHANFTSNRKAELVESAIKRQFGPQIGTERAYLDLIVYVY